jgi:hypothetical protein
MHWVLTDIVEAFREPKKNLLTIGVLAGTVAFAALAIMISLWLIAILT